MTKNDFTFTTQNPKISITVFVFQDSFNEHGSPSELLDFEDELIDKVAVSNPLFDYIPPGLVDLFITNIGGHPPSYIYRLISDFYNVEDHEL